MVKIYIAILILFLNGCANSQHDKTVIGNLELMKSKTVELSLDKMVCKFGAKDTIIDMDSAIVKMVVYVDSTECSPCVLDKMYLWNDIIDETSKYGEKMKYIFVFEPKQGDIELDNLFLAAEYSGLNNCIYIDTAMTFKKQNDFLPESKLYHSFLLDKNNRILFVGNPIDNKKIEEIFEGTIKSQLFKY